VVKCVLGADSADAEEELAGSGVELAGDGELAEFLTTEMLPPVLFEHAIDMTIVKTTQMMGSRVPRNERISIPKLYLGDPRE